MSSSQKHSIAAILNFLLGALGPWAWTAPRYLRKEQGEAVQTLGFGRPIFASDLQRRPKPGGGGGFQAFLGSGVLALREQDGGPGCGTHAEVAIP